MLLSVHGTSGKIWIQAPKDTVAGGDSFNKRIQADEHVALAFTNSTRYRSPKNDNTAITMTTKPTMYTIPFINCLISEVERSARTEARAESINSVRWCIELPLNSAVSMPAHIRADIHM